MRVVRGYSYKYKGREIMRRLNGSFLSVACCLMLVSTAVMAEEKRDTLRFSVASSAEWTDNRDSVADGDSNLDLYFSPRADVVLQLERTMLDLYYILSLRYRTDASELQNDTDLYHNLSADFSHSLTKMLKVKLSEKFNYTDDPSVSKGSTLLRRDSSYMLNTVSGDVDLQVTEQLKSQFSGDLMIKRYDDDERSLESDEEKLGLGMQVSHQMSQEMIVAGIANFSDYGYENSAVYDRDFQSVTVGAAANRALSSALRCGLRVGWTSVNYDDGMMGSDSAPYINGDVEVSLSELTRVIIGVSQSLKNSDVYPFASQVSSDVGMKMEWDPRHNVTAYGSANWRLGDYDSDTLAASGDTYLVENGYATSGDETTLICAVGVQCTLESGVMVSLAQRLEDVDSDVSVSYTRNSTTIGLSRRF